MDDENNNNKLFKNVQRSDTGVRVDIIPSDKISVRASSSHTNHNVRNIADSNTATKWTSNYSIETYKDDLYTNRKISKGDYSRGEIVKDGTNRRLLNDNQKKIDALRNKISTLKESINNKKRYYDSHKKKMKNLDPRNYMIGSSVLIGSSRRITKDVPIDTDVIRPINSTHVSNWSGEWVNVSIVSYGGKRYIRATRIKYNRPQDGWAAELRVPVYKIHWPSYYYWLQRERESVEEYNKIMDQNASSYTYQYNSQIKKAEKELNELQNININEIPVKITNDGKYIGNERTILTNNSVIKGEWINVEVPNTVTVNRYELLPGRRDDNPEQLTPFPKDFYLLGSNDRNKWEILDSHFDYKPVYSDNNTPIIFDFDNNKKYTSIRLVISGLNPTYTSFKGLGAVSLSIFNLSGNKCYSLNKSSCETFQSYINNTNMSNIEGLTMMEENMNVLADLKDFNEKYSKYIKCSDITLPDNIKQTCTVEDKNIDLVINAYDKLMDTENGSIHSLQFTHLNQFSLNSEYENNKSHVLTTHSEIVPLRQELDNKLKILMDEKNATTSDYTKTYDNTMSTSLVLSVILTSSLYFIFKKM